MSTSYQFQSPEEAVHANGALHTIGDDEQFIPLYYDEFRHPITLLPLNSHQYPSYLHTLDLHMIPSLAPDPTLLPGSPLNTRSPTGRPKRQRSREQARTIKNRCWFLRVSRGYSTEQISDQLQREGLGFVSPHHVQQLLTQYAQKQDEFYVHYSNVLRAEHIERLQLVVQESIRAYEESQGLQTTRQTTVTGKVHVHRNGDVQELPPLVTTEVVPDSPGDPRHLDQAMRAMEDQRKILGLDAAKKTDITSQGLPIKAYVGLDPEKV